MNLGLMVKLCFVAMACAFVAPTVASAGIPECGGIRLESVTACELRANIDCMAGCSRLGVYKKACATERHTVCRQTCTLSAEGGCTDECTVSCQAECDAGLNITCVHNCFGECVGSCDVTCEGQPADSNCRAQCEATCDGECDVQCAPVVDADCYTHCIECCGGSCTAQANMDCQTNCQEEEFETCEHAFEADCMASCSVDGALFCDDEFVLSGAEVPACINALLQRGLGGEIEAEGSVTIGGDGISGLGDGTAGCAVGATNASDSPSGWLAALGIGAVLAYRRRRALR